MKKKKLISIMLVLCLLVTALGAPAIALESGVVNSDRNVKLETLKMNRTRELDSLKEQLEAQGRMDHFEIHKMMIDRDYEKRKQIITGDAQVAGSYYSAPYGGQLIYEVKPGFGTTYTFAEDYFDGEQMLEIYYKYAVGELKTIGDFWEAIILRHFRIKYPIPGLIIGGFKVAVLFNKVCTNAQLNKIVNSTDGAGFNRTVEDSDGYTSTAWHIWDDFGYIPAPDGDVTSLIIN